MPRNTKKTESLFQFMNLLIALLLKNGQYHTSLHYRATLNSFKRYRSKTRQRLTIRWEKEMQELLEKYQAQTASSPYLFPFLVDDGNKSQDKTIDKKNATVRLYRNAEARISYHLRKLGAKIGVKGKLTLYVARHSWATAARDTISLSQSSARHWDIILKSPHKSISAPSKAQKWMMPMPGYWQFYKPKKE